MDAIALEDLLSQTVDVRDVHDRELVSEFTVFWSDIIVERLETLSNDQVFIALTGGDVFSIFLISFTQP